MRFQPKCGITLRYAKNSNLSVNQVTSRLAHIHHEY